MPRAGPSALATLFAGICAIVVGLGAGVASAAEPRSPFGPASAVVDDGALDRLRGGYVDARGVFASFGLERTTTVGGQVVFSQSVRIADLGRASVADLAALRSLVATTAVLQNAQGGQTVRNSVVLDATTNTLGILQRSGASRAMNDALIAPLVRP